MKDRTGGVRYSTYGSAQVILTFSDLGQCREAQALLDRKRWHKAGDSGLADCAFCGPEGTRFA